MEAKLIVSAIALVAGIVLARGRRKLAGLSASIESALMVTILVALIWTGRHYRDAVIVGALFLVGLAFWGWVVGAIIAVVIGGLSALVPGGSSVIVLGVVGIICVSVALDYLKMVDRIQRARKLEPGQRPSGDVILSGKARATGEVVLPLDELGKVAWYRLKMDASVQISERPIEIVTSAGTAIVEPKHVTFEIHGDGKSLTPEERTRVLGRPPTLAEAKASAQLHIIPDGADVFVLGAPDWEPSPRAEVSYREAPMVPIFRASADRPVVVEDRSDRVARGDQLWSLLAWMTWGALCATIALMQLSRML